MEIQTTIEDREIGKSRDINNSNNNTINKDNWVLEK